MASQTASPPASSLEPLLSQRDICHTFNISQRTLDRLRAGGKLPPPDLVLGRLPRWRRATIERWIAEQAR
jgi:predicted DNA-binding transcriptional regulator AlpA